MLPLLLYKLTGTHRYRPPFEWSSSWVYNIFRLWELVAWRREGIRREQIAYKDGRVFSFTLENYLATWEGVIRAWFVQRLAFKVVLIPQLQLAGMKQAYGIAPYRFAIAYDTAQVQQSSPATWSHTVTGSNPFIIVMTGSTTPPSNSSTGVTYNSVALTDQVNVLGTSNWARADLWTLGNPSTGANTVSVSGTPYFYEGSASYSGAQSSSTADNTGSNAVNSTGPNNVSITPVADNCWMVGWMQSADRAISAGTGTTAHSTGGDGFEFMCDNNAAIHPAASTTLQCTWSGGTSRVLGVALTIAPFASSATVSLGMTRTLMGVGS